MEIPTINETRAKLKGEMDAFKMIHQIVSRDFRTRDNIDLEHLLLCKIAQTERSLDDLSTK